MHETKKIFIDFKNEPLVRNACGCQPIMVKNGEIERSSLFMIKRKKQYSVGLKGKLYQVYQGDKYFYDIKVRNKEENDIIFKNQIHKSEIEQEIIYALLDNSTQFRCNNTVEEIVKEKKLNKLVEFHKALLYAKNCMNWGTTFISSNPLILNNIKFKLNNRFKYILLPESKLAKHVLIIGALSFNSFEEALVLSPLIDEDDYMDYQIENGLINYKSEVSPSSYKITPEYRDKYEKYEKYLNDVTPEYWYLEKFEHIENYYTTLIFKES